MTVLIKFIKKKLAILYGELLEIYILITFLQYSGYKHKVVDNLIQQGHLNKNIYTDKILTP